MKKIKIERITVGNNRRKLGDFTELAKSIEELGLINPVQVNNEFNLIAGLHRLEACKSLGWKEINAEVLTVDDIKAERIEIAENLFRIDLTTLERGQQYKRLKDLYEAEFPQTKHGRRNGQTCKTAESAVLETPAFVTDVSTKTNKPERTIREDVQIATNIPKKVQAIIKDLPVADNKSDLLKLARLNEHAQGEIAAVLAKKKVETVNDAIKVLDKDFSAAQPKPTNHQKTNNFLSGILEKINEVVQYAKTEATIELVVAKFNERELNVHYSNFIRLQKTINEWTTVLERQGAIFNGTINATEKQQKITNYEN